MIQCNVSQENSRIVNPDWIFYDCIPMLSISNECGYIWSHLDKPRKRMTFSAGVGPTRDAAQDAAVRACRVVTGKRCDVLDYPNGVWYINPTLTCCGAGWICDLDGSLRL